MDINQISVGNYHYIRYSLDYFLESMKRVGISNIELYAAGPHLYLDDYDYMRTRELARKLHSREMNVVCLTPEQCIYPISISADEPILRRRSINYFLKTIDIAETIGCEMVLVTPGTSMMDKDREKEVGICIDSLGLLADYASGKGILLVLEALAKTTSHIANTPQELKFLIDSVNNPSLKPMLDVDGAARLDFRPKDYFDLFGDNLKHIHYVDGFPGGHVVPGEGVLDMVGYLKEIEDAGYKNYLSLEILDRSYYLEPEHAVIKSLNFIKKYMGEK